MQRSSTRFLILSILVMAILVVIASSLIFDLANQFQNSKDVNIVEAASSSNFSAGYITAGDGLADGEIATANTSVTEITSWSIASGSGDYYLSSNIEITSKTIYEETTIFSGKLYGNGHTITINTGEILNTDSMSDEHQFGFLTGKF